MFDISLDRPVLPNLILRALQRPDRHVYGGTVPAGVVAERRGRNKRARAARRLNRRK